MTDQEKVVVYSKRNNVYSMYECDRGKKGRQ